MSRMKYNSNGGTTIVYSKQVAKSGRSWAGYRYMKSKFTSKCAACGQPIYRGKGMMWNPKKGRGVTHPKCLKQYAIENGWPL